METTDDGARFPEVTAEDVLRRYNSEGLPIFCEPITDVNQVGTFGDRPIHLACYRGNLQDVAALIGGGAQINVQGEMGVTPLHEAVEQNHIKVVQLLLQHGAAISIAIKDDFGRTPIDIARQNGNIDIVRVLQAATGPA